MPIDLIVHPPPIIELRITPIAHIQITARAGGTSGGGGETIEAGAGLTKSDSRLDVVSADGSIVVGADSIQVGVLQTDASHGNRGGGSQHTIATTSVAGFMAAADKIKLDSLNTDVDPHNTTHETGGADTINVTGLPGTLADPQKIEIAQAGALIAARKQINFIGATVTDNPGSNRADITITSSLPPVSSLINPLHWWRADNTVQSGGLVDTIVDNGSLARDFTQVGAARCPTAIDGNGQTYLAFDGASDYYQAGAVTDWTFLHDGSDWTIAILLEMPASPTIHQCIFGNGGGDSALRGFDFYWYFGAAASQGPYYALSAGLINQHVLFIQQTSPVSLTKQLWVFRHKDVGASSSAGGAMSTGQPALRFFRNGNLAQTGSKSATGYSTANPSQNLVLGCVILAGTPSRFTTARIYDIALDNKCWSDSQCIAFENYARSKGVAL